MKYKFIKIRLDLCGINCYLQAGTSAIWIKNNKFAQGTTYVLQFFFQVFESLLLSLYDGWSLLGKDCFSKGPFRCLSFFNVDLVPNNDYGTFSSVPFLGFINIVSNIHIYLISDTDEIHQNFNYNLLSFFYYYYFLVPIF